MKSLSIIAALVAIASATVAQACRCLPQTPRSAYRQASAVLLGTVQDARDLPRERRYRITVERSWKAPVRGTVTVNSARTSCLAHLEPGERYLIYVVRDATGAMRTAECHGNRSVADAGEALAWLARHR